MMSKGSKAKWGNWTGYIFLPLKLTPQNDPLEFVREAKTTMDKKKHSFGAIGTFFITRFAFNTFGVKVNIIPFLSFNISPRFLNSMMVSRVFKLFF